MPERLFQGLQMGAENLKKTTEIYNKLIEIMSSSKCDISELKLLNINFQMLALIEEQEEKIGKLEEEIETLKRNKHFQCYLN